MSQQLAPAAQKANHILGCIKIKITSEEILPFYPAPPKAPPVIGLRGKSTWANTG